MFIGLMKYWCFDDHLGPNVNKFVIFHYFYHHHFDAPSWRFHEILNITLLLPLLFEWRFYCVRIHNFMKLLIFRWFYRHHWMVWHMTFMIFFFEFSNILRSPLRPPRTPKDLPASPQGRPKAPPRTSQGPPRTFQGHPKLVILWNSI